MSTLENVAPRGSLASAPSLIERVWPAQKLSIEAQKERKAVQSQTLTALGSYWKGRKPLILARACIIGALLPSTGNDEQDLKIFDLLCGLADEQISARLKPSVPLDDLRKYGTEVEIDVLHHRLRGNLGSAPLSREQWRAAAANLVSRMPYHDRCDLLLRPEEVDETVLLAPFMPAINLALGTSAANLQELITELGTLRFGNRPRVCDTFSGGGSIPFEAARLGCVSIASDLNPIACMLTWAAINIIGATDEQRNARELAQRRVIQAVDTKICNLGVEHDSQGNRAKAYLYCVETLCPKTGWRVPLSSTWIVSKSRRIVAKLIPDVNKKAFDIAIAPDASDEEMAEAETGTVDGNTLRYELDGETITIPLRTLRGDRQASNGTPVSDLRRWEKTDFIPRPDDLFQERLYCIQWMTQTSLDKSRQETFFAAPTAEDLARERAVEAFVRSNIGEWQRLGVIPDMPIESGENTDQPIRERGWTYWHHLFSARQLLFCGLTKLEIDRAKSPELYVGFARLLDWSSKLCRYGTGAARESIAQTFYNQALNTFVNYGVRSFWFASRYLNEDYKSASLNSEGFTLRCQPADDLVDDADLFITDPPYADAINYHEITEFFIAWLRKSPPAPFSDFTWDSRRLLAITGDNETFRRRMVSAYRAMAEHMPGNGIQIVMFTHQDAKVWADMAQIFWGAGLRVMAAWYIATETSSDLRKGGYVQGTVILVLRKRNSDESGYKDEIVQEVKSEVADQIEMLTGLNQTLRGHGRIENLFEDADLQMAGYAAALRVLTKYTSIDGIDMTREALRYQTGPDNSLVTEVIDFAVQVANEHMVPQSMQNTTWTQLSRSERFYLKMMDIETTPLRKLDNYQNFAKAFRFANYTDVMGSMEPNKARLKSAKEFKRNLFDSSDFGSSLTRIVLFALFELQTDIDGEIVLSHLRDLVPSYYTQRAMLIAIADYIAIKRVQVNDSEARAARILYELLRNERLS